MARRARPRYSRAVKPGRVLAIVLVIIFAVVDVLLIALIVTRDGATDETAPSESSSPTADVQPSVTPTPTSAAVVSAPRQLIPVDASDLWRASTGSCPTTAAIVDHSVDGGATWQTVTIAGIDVRQVLELAPQGDATVWLAARTGAECVVSAFASYTDGEFWGTYPGAISDFAYLDPALIIGGVPVAASCAPVTQVRSVGDRVVATCPDALSERVGDSGEWTTLAIPGLLATAPSGDGYVAAVWGAPECAGISVRYVASPVGSAEPVVRGCASEETVPDQVTIAQFESTVWLWSADRLSVSADGGASWSRRG